MPRPDALLLFAATLCLMLAAPMADAATCTANSGARRVALLELYTSEGCDSCPPADRWVSGLAGRGLDTSRVIVLGFHVDYWNYLGWNDPYASASYSARQRAASERNRARVIYTPQLLLNGRDYRRGIFGDGFADRVASLNRSRPGADIRVRLSVQSAGRLAVEGVATVPDAADRPHARAYLALFENNLATRVTAGENRGRHLRHDYVVRALAGPYSPEGDSIRFGHAFEVPGGWKRGDLHLAAFVQDERTGDVLQALASPYCR